VNTFKDTLILLSSGLIVVIGFFGNIYLILSDNFILKLIGGALIVIEFLCFLYVFNVFNVFHLYKKRRKARLHKGNCHC